MFGEFERWWNRKTDESGDRCGKGREKPDKCGTAWRAKRTPPACKKWVSRSSSLGQPVVLLQVRLWCRSTTVSLRAYQATTLRAL